MSSASDVLHVFAINFDYHLGGTVPHYAQQFPEKGEKIIHPLAKG
jgi:hypothetical protein